MKKDKELDVEWENEEYEHEYRRETDKKLPKIPVK